MGDAAARDRLTAERKALLKDKPIGMYAKPSKNKDGSVDILTWELGIMPKTGSLFELPDQGTYRVMLKFPPQYPVKPPIVMFDPPVFHPNLFTDGRCCLSILLEEGHHHGRDGHSHWTPGISVKDIMGGLQQFLEEPNPDSVAHKEAAALCKASKKDFNERVKKEALLYPARLAAAQKLGR